MQVLDENITQLFDNLYPRRRRVNLRSSQSLFSFFEFIIWIFRTSSSCTQAGARFVSLRSLPESVKRSKVRQTISWSLFLALPLSLPTRIMCPDKYIILRRASLLEMGTLMSHRSFLLATGGGSRNLISTIVLWGVHVADGKNDKH